MNQNHSITGVLLAGGQARRFGEAKAFAFYQDKPFYTYSLDALSSVLENTLIISHPELVANFTSREHTVPVYTDKEPFQGCGPLAGIVTAMRISQSDWYITAPCDTPLITVELMKHILSEAKEEFDCVIPVVEGRRQPLIAMYHRRTKPVIEELLKEGIYKVGALIERVSVHYVEADTWKNAFRNINTKEDLAEIEKAEEQ